jgi:hypothetical protein
MRCASRRGSAIKAQLRQAMEENAAMLAAGERRGGKQYDVLLAAARRRVNLIVVNAFANDRARQAPLEAAVRAVDFAALRALLR